MDWIWPGLPWMIIGALLLSYFDSKLRERVIYLMGRDQAFKGGLLKGRNWLAEMMAEAEQAHDKRDDWLRFKKHRALKAAELVAEIKSEKRDLATRLKFVEYQLKSYEEYFPFLVEYRDALLDETIPLGSTDDSQQALEEADPTVRYLSREEWLALAPGTRNQLALDRYIGRPKENWEIGRVYERYIGFLRETAGWEVEFHGALKGFEDLGRDLVCRREGCVEIVQAKCWSAAKLIHEKHIFQLYGTTLLFRIQNGVADASAVFVSTTGLSEVATLAASELGVRVERTPLMVDYPMIKCNVNQATGERIYHLPMDQQYDRVRIAKTDERYAKTVAEAEASGFRRAWRYKGK